MGAAVAGVFWGVLRGGVRTENKTPKNNTHGAVTSALLLGIGSAMMFDNPTVVQFKVKSALERGCRCSDGKLLTTLNLAWGWPLGVAGFWWGEGRGPGKSQKFPRWLGCWATVTLNTDPYSANKLA